MTAQELMEKYKEGRETPAGIVLDVLSQTSKRVVTETLELLPTDILKELKSFVGYYNPKTKVFRGPRPKMATVRVVKDWFAKADSSRPQAHRPGESKIIRTVPIDNNPAFRELQEYADSVLKARGYKLLEKK